MIRTLIIDDEPAIRKDIQTLLSRHAAFICIGACGSLAEAKVLIAATQPDLVLLDIQLSDGTGFELLKSLPEIPFKIIFVTAYNDQAIRAIKFGALDYLVKPLDDEEFSEALQRMQDSRANPPQLATQLQVTQEYLQNGPQRNRIILRTQNYLQIVQHEEIIYCQSDGGYTHFFLTDKRTALVSKSIKEYEDMLPAARFIRTHQSFLVNIDCIGRYHKDGYLILKNGNEIPVATRKKDHLLKLLTGES